MRQGWQQGRGNVGLQAQRAQTLMCSSGGSQFAHTQMPRWWVDGRVTDASKLVCAGLRQGRSLTARSAQQQVAPDLVPHFLCCLGFEHANALDPRPSPPTEAQRRRRQQLICRSPPRNCLHSQHPQTQRRAAQKITFRLLSGLLACWMQGLVCWCWGAEVSHCFSGRGWRSDSPASDREAHPCGVPGSTRVLGIGFGIHDSRGQGLDGHGLPFTRLC